MQNLRKLCLSGKLGNLVGTAVEQFPVSAGICAAGGSTERNRGPWKRVICSVICCRSGDGRSLKDSLCMCFTLALCLYSKGVLEILRLSSSCHWAHKYLFLSWKCQTEMQCPWDKKCSWVSNSGQILSPLPHPPPLGFNFLERISYVEKLPDSLWCM